MWASAEYAGLSPLSREAFGRLEPNMRVPDNIRKTVVYIGRGDHGPFTPYGTGFVIVSFIDDRSFQPSSPLSTLSTAWATLIRFGSV